VIPFEVPKDSRAVSPAASSRSISSKSGAATAAELSVAMNLKVKFSM